MSSKFKLKYLFFWIAVFVAAIGVKAQSPTPSPASTAVQTPADAAPKKPLIGITPILVIANIQPGKTFTQAFTLENSSNSYVRFRCTLGDYRFDEKNVLVLAPAGTLPRSASSWIQFAPSEIIVAPQTSTVVKALISVPPTAVGGYYSMPFFEAEASEPPNLGQSNKSELRGVSAIALKIGGLFLLATEKISNYKIDILNSQVSPPTADSEFQLSLDVVNQGNVHAYLRGVFAILDESGKLVGQGKLENQMLLPAQSGKLRGSWAGTLPVGNYSVVSTISYDRAGLTPTSLVDEIPLNVLK